MFNDGSAVSVSQIITGDQLYQQGRRSQALEFYRLAEGMPLEAKKGGRGRSALGSLLGGRLPTDNIKME